jgi:hypothetical protein
MPWPKEVLQDDESPPHHDPEIWQEVYEAEKKRVDEQILRILDCIYRMAGPEPPYNDWKAHRNWEERYDAAWKYYHEDIPTQKADQAAQRGTRVSWQRIRRIVFERDGAICQICGAQLKWDVNYECGHIVDRIMGGSDRPSNLLAMCIRCNRDLKPLHGSKAEFFDWAQQIGALGSW